MLIGRKDLRRIANGDPTNGNHRSCWELGSDVDDAINAHLRSCSNMRSIEDRYSRSKKDIVFHNTPCQVRPWPDQDRIAKTSGEIRCPTDHSVFHDNAVSPNFDWTPFGHNDCPKEDATIFSNRDIPTDRGCWGDIGRWMDMWHLPAMFKEQTRSPFLSSEALA